MSDTCPATVCPPEKAPGWLTTGVEDTVTERLPCATALGASATDWFITTEPVRAFTITLAGAAVSATSIDSSSARKPTRCAGSRGSGTCTTRASIATAWRPSLPGRRRIFWLIASVTSRTSEKSVRLSSTRIESPSSV